ncbi:MAG: 16S rRNA (adenine(1518)-N(6)/adenine(1519)-N(6))-dimethyltransferase RsmA [Chlorobiales bacterium]|nr:16S rRNA (adenine(1518)-N(6)/adenine(1519)-N(6))-dimethyltransferase RsmA [Chlorobiales bacterium]
MRVKYKDTEVATKKSFGQNFLLDANIPRKMVRQAELETDDHVLEIGPGFGALTRAISEIVPSFTAVELDKDLAAFIRREFPQVQLIEGDFLKTDLLGLGKDKQLKVLGNIPYAITTPILFKLLDERAFITSAVLMMQEEVARRLTAHPKTKEYGILAVQLQAFCQIEYLFRISKAVFKPRPDVDSAVIKLVFKQNCGIEDAAYFRALVRRAFQMRRKTLSNNLKADYKLENIAFDFTRRAEELTVEEFVELARLLKLAA